MTAIADIIDEIWTARRLTKPALDELQRTGGDWQTSDAGKTYTAACVAERDAVRELAKARAIDYADIILKASVLIDFQHDEMYEDELPAPKASIDRDIAAVSPISPRLAVLSGVRAMVMRENAIAGAAR